jgi:integrase
MTTATLPKIRFHKASGQYLAVLPKSGGGHRYLYLGRDENAARSRLDAELASLPTCTPSLADDVVAVVLPKRKERGVTVRLAAESLIDYAGANGVDNPEKHRKWVRQCLSALLEAHGSMLVARLEVEHLEAIQEALKKEHKPCTVRHYVSNMKRLVKYAAHMGWRETIEFQFMRRVSMPAAKPKHYSLDLLSKYLCAARDKDYSWKAKSGIVYNAMRLQLLTACRPSEVFRLLNGQYEIVEDGVAILNKSKTDKSAGVARTILLSPLAKEMLSTKVDWKCPLGYYWACKHAFNDKPHNLRHSAAWMLHRMPERPSREDVDVVLGHKLDGVSLVYNTVDWPRYVAMMERYQIHLNTLFAGHF